MLALTDNHWLLSYRLLPSAIGSLPSAIGYYPLLLALPSAIGSTLCYWLYPLLLAYSTLCYSRWLYPLLLALPSAIGSTLCYYPLLFSTLCSTLCYYLATLLSATGSTLCYWLYPLLLALPSTITGYTLSTQDHTVSVIYSLKVI